MFLEGLKQGFDVTLSYSLYQVGRMVLGVQLSGELKPLNAGIYPFGNTLDQRENQLVIAVRALVPDLMSLCLESVLDLMRQEFIANPLEVAIVLVADTQRSKLLTS